MTSNETPHETRAAYLLRCPPVALGGQEDCIRGHTKLASNRLYEMKKNSKNMLPKWLSLMAMELPTTVLLGLAIMVASAAVAAPDGRLLSAQVLSLVGLLQDAAAVAAGH